MNNKDIIKKHKDNGVKFLNAQSVEIDEETIIEKNVEIGFGVKLEQSFLMSGNKIGNNCTIINSKIGKNNNISQSQIESSALGENNIVGPFSHLRPNSFIGNNCKIGNFVEIKNSHIGDGTKISHLAYVGDATLGKNINIGCGVIFANYDGKNKYHTDVGDNAFIGSNCNLIAPLKIGAGVLVGAGTTVTKDIPANKLCIGRVRQEIKELKSYSQTKRLFGTDGIRGKFGSEITCDIAYKCGNALSSILKSANILIGRDTRKTGKTLVKSFCNGAKVGGANIVDTGILPTPAISYLTQKNKFDFGVVISASHNSEEYNGIKIFAFDGKKLSEQEEMQIEQNMKENFTFAGGKISKHNMKEEYIDFLNNSISGKLKNLKILVDNANGATKQTVEVFKKLGANLKIIKNRNKGINSNCGSTYITNIKNNFNTEDIGFSFDGDGDRILCVLDKEIVFDGDKILLLIALYNKINGTLSNNIVVGTLHTNMAIEEELFKNDIILERANIGDKYVVKKMMENGSKFGAEQSGHVIMINYLNSGDGVLTALKLCEIMQKSSDLFDYVKNVKLYPQENLNYVVKDKQKILQNENLIKLKKENEKIFGNEGRILIRASGTEPKIRIMIEHKKESICKNVAKEFDNLLKIICD